MYGTVLRRLPSTASTSWFKNSICTSSVRLCDALKHKEAPILDNEVILAKRELQEREKLSHTIEIPKEKNISPIIGVPEEHIKERRVRIFTPAKNCMQSGTDNIHFWRMEFDNRQRWENPLMGWCSSGDPLSNTILEFNTKEEAISHCEKNGWRWFVDSNEKPKKQRDKNYGNNYAWNRRTRVSTK